MNEFLIAALLGVVEGLTEFLPVSSTAHLRIAQHFLGLPMEDEYWKLFAIFIQLGAILSVVVLYRIRLAGILRSFLRAPSLKHPFSLVMMAFLATAIPSFLLKKVIGANLENIPMMAGSLVVGGFVMIFVDKLFSTKGKVERLEDMKPWQALLIGVAQIFSAVFPGTSRSMSTIAGGQVAGLTRSAALEFSFLLSVPIMVVATLYDLFKYLKAGGAALSSHQTSVLAVGFFVSFVVACAAISWFLAFVRTRGFVAFGIYRILLGIGLLFLL